MQSGRNILLGLSGSIAAYKAPFLIRSLVKLNFNVKVVMTNDAEKFVTKHTLSTVSNNTVYSNFFKENGNWENHVKLAKWADLFLIAPATLNTIGKMANGICDNLLLATYFSCNCPVYIAPAMDLDMYKHPSLQKNINTLESFGNIIIAAESGFLASGLIGEGRMSEIETITTLIKNHFSENKSMLNGKKVLITAGATIEKIDPVRYISNFSTGKMGIALTSEALKRGAKVSLVVGKLEVAIPNSNQLEVDKVFSAEQMLKSCKEHTKKADIIIMAAAVADYKPRIYFKEKIKKHLNTKSIALKENTDILEFLSTKRKKNQLVAGFALESENEIANAIKKLDKKKLDFIILNSLNSKEAGFGYDTNKITIIDKKHKATNFKRKDKEEVAKDILDYLSKKL